MFPLIGQLTVPPPPHDYGVNSQCDGRLTIEPWSLAFGIVVLSFASRRIWRLDSKSLIVFFLIIIPRLQKGNIPIDSKTPFDAQV